MDVERHGSNGTQQSSNSQTEEVCARNLLATQKENLELRKEVDWMRRRCKELKSGSSAPFTGKRFHPTYMDFPPSKL